MLLRLYLLSIAQDKLCGKENGLVIRGTKTKEKRSFTSPQHALTPDQDLSS